jgi:hypothetical protein
MPMTPERLRAITYDARISDANYSHGMAVDTSEAERALAHRNELLDYVDALIAQNTELRDSVIQVTSIVDELTRSRDDARRIAIDSGAFQSHKGTDYDFEEYHPHDGCMKWRDDSWRADPVGPVAWDRQVQQ